MLWYYFHWRFHMVSISLVVLQALIHTDVIKPTGKELSIAMSSFSKYSTLFKCFDLIRMFFFFSLFSRVCRNWHLEKRSQPEKKALYKFVQQLIPIWRFISLLLPSSLKKEKKLSSMGLLFYASECFHNKKHKINDSMLRIIA